MRVSPAARWPPPRHQEPGEPERASSLVREHIRGFYEPRSWDVAVQAEVAPVAFP